jgi:hypothetical protein
VKLLNVRIASALLAAGLLAAAGAAAAFADDGDRDRAARVALALAAPKHAPAARPKEAPAGGIAAAELPARADKKGGCACPCCDKCPACPPALWPDVKAVRDSCTRIRRGGAMGSATCVWTDGARSVVLTAAHVLDHAGVVEVRVDGKWVAGSVIRSDAAADLAAALVPAALPAVKVAASDPARGAKVLMVGCTTLWSRGAINGGAALNGTSVYTLGYDSDSGDSGAGVFCGGELVGVHCGKFGARAPADPYCVAARPVREFLGGVLVSRGGKVVPSEPVQMPALAKPADDFELWMIDGRFVRVPKGQRPSLGGCPGGVCPPAPPYPAPGRPSCPNGRCPPPR